MEIVSFSYKKIRWIYEPDGIEAEDCFCVCDWGVCPHPLQDIIKGLGFGFKASWEVTKHTFSQFIARDILISLANFIPVHKGFGFFMGRSVSLKQINDGFNNSEKTIKELSSKIEKIRYDVFSR